MIGTEWIAACVVPWAVSPHPNFSVETVRPAGQLALIAEFRHGDRERWEAQGKSAWESQLIDAARDSIQATTQRSAASSLLTLVDDRNLPMGARAAAVAYAAVALSELDEPEAAVVALERLLADLDPHEGEFLDSKRLVIGQTRLQLARRLYEASRFQASHDAARTAIEELPDASGRDFESFEVSKGIRWTSSGVQSDIRRAVEQRARAVLTRLEGFSGRSWIDVVRARRSWPQIKLGQVSDNRDSAYAAKAFEDAMDSLQSRIRLGGGDSIELNGRVALLIAELSADVMMAQSAALSLGRLNLIRDETRVPSYVAENLRLLRQSGSREDLEQGLQLTRAAGPWEALLEAATLVLDRPSFPDRVTSVDLAVIGAAADLLNEAQIGRALSGVWGYFHTPKRESERGVAQLRRAWATVALLAPGSSRDAEIASELLATVSSPSVVESLGNAVGQVVDAVEWGAVPSTIRKQWESILVGTEWTSAVSGNTAVNPTNELSDTDLVMNALRNDTFDTGRPELVEACLRLLSRLAEEAKQPHVAIGGVEELDLVTAYAIASRADELWPPIVEMLGDPRLDAFRKADALDRIIAWRKRLSEETTSLFGSAWAGIVASRTDRGFLRDAGSGVFPEAMRFGAVFGLVNRQQLFESLMRDATDSSSRTRAGAAETLGLIPGDVAATMLLQLVRDPRPAVRAEASRALVAQVFEELTISDLVVDAVVRSLQDPGIRIALFTLHGIQRAALDKERIPPKVLNQVASLAQDHASRVIRAAATNALLRGSGHH